MRTTAEKADRKALTAILSLSLSSRSFLYGGSLRRLKHVAAVGSRSGEIDGPPTMLHRDFRVEVMVCIGVVEDEVDAVDCEVGATYRMVNGGSMALKPPIGGF